MYTFKQVKTHLRQQSGLKFKGFTKEDVGTNLESFLENILIYNNKYPTVYTTNGQTQTGAGKRRSIGDLFRLTYFYFPKITLTTLYTSLLKLVIEKKALSSICEATGLRVYRAAKDGEITYFNGTPTDEFYTDFKQFEEFKQCKSAKDYWGYTFKEDKINFVEF